VSSNHAAMMSKTLKFLLIETSNKLDVVPPQSNAAVFDT